jgi:hypothetical protein
MSSNASNLVDLLIIGGDIVLDEHGLPQLIGGRDVVAQDIGHRLEDAGLVFLLLGERSKNAIKSLLLKIRLEVEKDTRVIPGTVKTSFDMMSEVGVLNILAKTRVGDVAIAIPVIPEKYQPLPDVGEQPRIIFSLPIDLGNAENIVQEIIDFGNAENVVPFIVDLGSADSTLNTDGVVIYEDSEQVI